MIYYRALATTGVALEFAVMASLGPNALVALLKKDGAVLPISCGILATFATGWLIDRRAKRPGGILWAPVIFVSGALIGCVVNGLQWQSLPERQAFDYFYGPLYLLMMFGTPLSLIVGALGKLAWWVSRRASAPKP